MTIDAMVVREWKEVPRRRDELLRPFEAPLSPAYSVASKPFARGWQKDAFAGTDSEGRDVVVRALRFRADARTGTLALRDPTSVKRLSRLWQEYAAMEGLRAHDMPVAPLLAIGSLQGMPADACLRYVTTTRDREKVEQEAESLFDEAALADLHQVRRLFESGVVVSDFQALLRPGAFHVFDAEGVYCPHQRVGSLAAVGYRHSTRRQEAVLDWIESVAGVGTAYAWNP